MKARMWLALALGILAFGLFLFPADAHAYLDPGTGSYILQIAIAAIFGILFAIRLFWGRIKSFLGKLFSEWTRTGQDGK